MLSSQRLTSIECITLDLLKDTFSQDNFPIDIDTLILKSGLSFAGAIFKESSVVGAYDRNKKIIYLKEKQATQEQLFTIAHELGH